jgi:hypothetical protein
MQQHRRALETKHNTLTTSALPQVPHDAFPSGRTCSPATSSTPRLKTTPARRSAAPCSRTTTSACTTGKRCALHNPVMMRSERAREKTYADREGHFLLTEGISCVGRQNHSPPSRLPPQGSRNPQRQRALGRPDSDTGPAEPHRRGGQHLPRQVHSQDHAHERF